MSISHELSAYADHLLPSHVEAVERVLALVPEKVQAYIPSLELGSDGPRMESVFLVTESYLAEVHLQSLGVDFDVIRARTIGNYRIHLYDHLVKTSDGTEVTYEVATIALLHHLGSNFGSRIKYVGPNRQAWLQLVLHALPISLLA